MKKDLILCIGLFTYSIQVTCTASTKEMTGNI